MTTVSTKIIPTMEIDDQLNFKDYLLEFGVEWTSLSGNQKIEQTESYLMEELNADFFIKKVTESSAEIVCSRVIDKKELNLDSLDLLSGQITHILNNLVGCPV